jgi:ABC-type antimicrobial peptide transport system permease subunit
MFFVPLTQTTPYQDEDMKNTETRSHFIHSAVVVYHGTLDKFEPQVRKAFAEIDPDIPVTDIHTMQDRISSNFDQQRTVAKLAGLFSSLALILAAIGLYGVTAYSVARRTNEIGVRMALGADRSSILITVLQIAIKQVTLGLLIGIPVAIGCARLLSRQLFQIGKWDPAPLLSAIALLAACTVIAAVIPAQRAASLDPMKALRTE